MPASFPWPVTDDALFLNHVLDQVVAAYEPRGENEAAWIAEAAGKLIVEAYQQGVRDPDTLVHYALKTLRRGRTGMGAP
jgi:hypothetical protein